MLYKNCTYWNEGLYYLRPKKILDLRRKKIVPKMEFGIKAWFFGFLWFSLNAKKNLSELKKIFNLHDQFSP